MNWHKNVLKAAAVYNILWGAWVVLFPQQFFQLTNMEPINHAMIWQGMGMVIGVYGLGYYWASSDPVRHWPIIAVGMLGKIFGPLGYVMNLILGTADPSFGLTLITNDLIWWYPFAHMLWYARRQHQLT
jgi:small multidrug resistance pump